MAWYEVDSLTITVGSVAWGDISRTTASDGVKLGLNEVAATPGFDYQFLFESIPGSVYTFRFRLDGYYGGSLSHTVLAQAWNYTLSSWTTLGTLVSNTSDQLYLFPTIPASDYVSGGQAKIRFLHSSGGTVGHYLRIDQLIIDVITTTTAIPTTPVPTTVPPTTLAPTTTLTTGVPPTTVVGTSPVPSTAVPTTPAPTTVPPTTVVPTTSVPTTPPYHISANDVTFNCYANYYAGVLLVGTTISGSILGHSYGVADLELAAGTTISGSFPLSQLASGDDLEAGTTISGSAVANDNRKNWIGWSKIGDVSFELDLVNDAGFKPMDWQGSVYQVRRLGKDVIIYGGGGVTRGYPVSSPMPTFGFKNLLTIGIKNKTAATGDEYIHFCIDVQGCLYAISTSSSAIEPAPKVERLGYEEYLRDLVNPAMHWDKDKRRLYISDESNGFIYNAGVLTGGYANLTGLYRVKQEFTGVSPDEIVAEAVEVWTDIIDFEHSGLKSIESTQYNAHSAVPLEGAIRYRYENQEEFKQTKWSQLNNQGISHLRAAGIEFKVGLRGLDWGTFNLSFIKINFKYIDQRFTRDPRRPLKEY